MGEVSQSVSLWQNSVTELFLESVISCIITSYSTIVVVLVAIIIIIIMKIKGNF